MKRFKDKFTTFILTALKILIAIILYTSRDIISKIIKEFSFNIACVFFIFAIVIFSLYKIINSTINIKNQVVLILVCAFALRALWLLNVNSIPVSDFKVIYDSAGYFLKGDRSMFWGTSYMARFPHLTIMVLYMALMIKLFPVHNLLIMKMVNLSLGVLSVFLIYLIVRKMFNSEKKGLIAAALASVFPPLITYTAVFCTENIAIPFYLLSIYLLLGAMKKKNSGYYFVLSGVVLAFGNLFRMVAIIMVIAYGMYLLIYRDDKLIVKIQHLLLYLVPYLLVMFVVSASLQYMKITENSLTKGIEPKITNVLKGTNYENKGKWNSEDAAISEMYNYDYDKIHEASKKIIVERLTTTPPRKLLNFYINKFADQWNEGDLSGVFWSQLDVPKDDIKLDIMPSGRKVLQLIYNCIILLIFIGLFNRKKIDENKEINLFYIIFCGYALLYLITEAQGRYSYIASWVLIVLAIEGIELISFKHRKKEEV